MKELRANFVLQQPRKKKMIKENYSNQNNENLRLKLIINIF